MKNNQPPPLRRGVAIGVPVYNGELYLREALNDLQRQSFRNFRVFVLNDGSTDQSEEIIKEYLDDSRFQYERFPIHRGKIEAWKRTAEWANAVAHPLYFAYYSDHGRVDPTWLESLFNVLENDNQCACAYARTKCIGVDGHPLPGVDRGIHTQNVPLWKRLKQACAFDIGAENVVYGLFRTEVLEKCGWFRDEIFPEKLLASEVNVYGTVARVNSVVRFHRLTSFVPGGKKTLLRQKLALFPHGSERTALVSSHVTRFLRELFPTSVQAESDFILRLVHAVLYFSNGCSKLRSILLSELEREHFSNELKPFKKFIHLGLGNFLAHIEGSAPFSTLLKGDDFSLESVVARFPLARFLGPLAVPGFRFMRSVKRLVRKKKTPLAHSSKTPQRLSPVSRGQEKTPLRLIHREPSETDSAQVYTYYQEVRNQIQSLTQHGEDSLTRPSQYWTEELSNFDYMMEASPLIVRKLRHHCFHITGLRVYDYRTNKIKEKAQFLNKLYSLQALDTNGNLLVPEPRALGGFGFEFDGELFNIDTLKYYEVLLGLDVSGVLRDLRRDEKRKLVWEIGAGWGGFPYQFKTIVPHVTYVIVDLPELFLFSAVYLRALFPQARLRLCVNIPVEEIFSQWEDYDFIFIPNTLLSTLAFPQIDLMINMVSFQEMTAEQVEAYVKKAADAQCRHLYSLNMWKPKYNSELSDLNPILSRYYDTQRVRLLKVGYNVLDVPEKGSPVSLKKEKEGEGGVYDSGYIHLKGDLRMNAELDPTRCELKSAVSPAK